MNASWQVTHDPLRLIEAESDLSRFEAAAREHGEDLVQAECIGAAKKKILDLGWYGGRYQVVLVEDDWSAPLKKIEAFDLRSAVTAFQQLAV